MKFLLALLLPLAANAQLTLVAVNGSAETAVGSLYNYGQVAAGTTLDAHFRVHNNGSTATAITVLTVNGAGFTLDRPTIPYTIAPTQAMDFVVHFSPTMPASYSASMQVNTISVFLLATGIATPTLAASSGCSGTNPIDFGRVQRSLTTTCNLTLTNPYSTSLSLSSATISGTGFTGPSGLVTPVTLYPGQTITFSINFTPPDQGTFSGSFVLGSQTFPLTGVGTLPPLPTPSLQFDSGTAASGQQRVLTMPIPGGSPISATGYVNISFKPATPVVKDDTSIMFLANGTRTIPFSVNQGDTQVLLNGQASAAFQTGTTEGIIAFSITTAATLVGDPTTTMTIPGTAVMIESASASNQRLGELDITLVGADNTYSSGVFSFTFFDSNGNPIGGAISADFSSTFKNYFAGSTTGSTFRVEVSFPVQGTQTQVASVEMTMTNAAGPVSTGKLTFQ